MAQAIALAMLVTLVLYVYLAVMATLIAIFVGLDIAWLPTLAIGAGVFVGYKVWRKS